MEWGWGSLANSIAMASSGSVAIQSSTWPGCSHTGIRSWISADTPLLSPVMMVKVPRPPLRIRLTEQAAPPRFPDETHYHAVTPKTAYMPSRPL